MHASGSYFTHLQRSCNYPPEPPSVGLGKAHFTSHPFPSVKSCESDGGHRLAKKPLNPGCFTRAPVPFCWCWFWGEEVRTAPSSALLSPVRPWQGPVLCTSTNTDSELSPYGWMDLPPDRCSSPYTLPLDSPFELPSLVMLFTLKASAVPATV